MVATLRQLAQRLLLALAFLVTAAAPPLFAQGLPQWQQMTVNDFARALSLENVQELDQMLSRLRADTGIEGTVVTLKNRADHGGTDGLGPFAKRLFNSWGIGDRTRNDGFMLLVLTEDREARIELGRGYSPEADILAQDIMRNVILPGFEQGDLPAGITKGTQSVIDLIARPMAQAAPIDNPYREGATRGNWLFRLIPMGFIGFVIVMIFRRSRNRNRCPQCGQRGLTTSFAPQEIPQADGGYLVKDDMITKTCPHCGWQDSRPRPRPMIGWYGPTGLLLREERNRNVAIKPGREGGGGFGGGSSSGGGASGRW